MTVDELQVVITANTAGLRTAVTGATGQINRMQSQTNSASNGMQKSFGRIVKSALTVTAVMGAGLGMFKLAESASNLSEAQNVVETTFKKSGKAIEAWAKTTAKSAGISETASTQWVGFMGAMLKSSGVGETSSASMSKNLVQLTGDMSSFYNVDTKDMWEKLRSGISGETEPLKALGINMSVANLEAYSLAEGIKKPYKEMTQGEQTQLRYNYLMKTTKDAQGDFGKTLSTSFANQVRVAQLNIETLGQKIGTQLLPSFNKAFTWVNGNMPLIESVMTTVFNGIKTAVSVAVNVFKVLVNALIPVGTWISNNQALVTNIGIVVASFAASWGLVNLALGIWATVGTIATAVTTGFGIAVAFLTSPIGIAIIAIGAAIAIGVLLYKNWDKVKATAGRLSSTIKTHFNNIKNSIIKPINSAKDSVRNAVNAIKGFFTNLRLPAIRIPHIRLPHFSLRGSFSLVPPRVPKLGVNWYQNGGVFDKASMIGVGENGSEAVVPLERNLGWVDKMASKITDKMGNNGGGLNLNIENFVNNRSQDIESLAEELSFYMQRKQIGGSR